MKRKLTSVLLALSLASSALSACGGSSSSSETTTQATTTAQAAETEENGISDDAFTYMQETYAELVEVYEAVAEIYNMEEVVEDEEITEALNKTRELMEELGAVTRDQLSDEDIEDYNEAIAGLLSILQAAYEEMEVYVETEDVEDVEDADAVSDETWENIQVTYAGIVEMYTMVYQEYTTNEDIPADAELEEYLEQAAELISEMGDGNGEISDASRGGVTEAQAQEAFEMMSAMSENLYQVGITLGIEWEYIPDDFDDTAEVGTDEAVSDETWESVQFTYASLVEAYTTVYTEYSTNEDIPADAELEEYLEQAAELISQMGDENGEISDASREGVSEAQALEALEMMNALGENLFQMGETIGVAWG